MCEEYFAKDAQESEFASSEAQGAQRDGDLGKFECAQSGSQSLDARVCSLDARLERCVGIHGFQEGGGLAGHL